MCVLKHSCILKVKNILVKYVYHVTGYTTFSLVTLPERHKPQSLYRTGGQLLNQLSLSLPVRHNTMQITALKYFKVPTMVNK
jgi:hypothetical protein